MVSAGYNGSRNQQEACPMKRILTIQDISCVGKCSLTVALPIISAMGVEASILPTAVLSTHTMFRGFTCKDLTDQIGPITSHWQQEKLTFSALYTGYLASFEQIDLMKRLFADFRTPENFTFVDPAMADNGKLYAAFDMAFAKHMASLCACADVIVPNVTEAAFMTGAAYRADPDEAYAKDLLRRLADLGPRLSILTGVGLAPDKTGVMGYDRERGEFYHYVHDKLPVSYHGTGDIFSSCCVGALARGMDWKQAVGLAADYTARCIALTLEDPSEPWYGVNFEQAIPWLVNKLA